MKTCAYCQKEVKDTAVKCRYCGGWFDSDADSRQQDIDQTERKKNIKAGVEKHLKDKKDSTTIGINEDIAYYHVPLAQLIIFSILTFGLFELYWFYKNWKIIKIREGRKIRPLWRAVFVYFYCYTFFKRILTTAKNKGCQVNVSPILLAIFYIVLGILIELPSPYDALSLLSIIPLVYANGIVSSINQQVSEEPLEKFRFNLPLTLFIVVGVLAWLDTFFPG